MKKILHLLMVSLLAFSLAACTPLASETSDNIVSEPFNQSYDSNSPQTKSSEHSTAADSPVGNIIDEESTSESSMDDSSTSESSMDDSSTGEESLSSEDADFSGQIEIKELPEDGTYTTKEDVSLYIHLYGCLPSNFITKKEAEALGWKGGSLEPYAPGMCIGGNRFGNYEGLLPEKKGRSYTECDIDTLGADKRGTKRIVFSNDGLIYYTEDHYESFELLYGEE